MKIMVAIGVILLPIILLQIYSLLGRWRFILDGIAVISAMLFGITSATAVYQIRRDGTIFMTNIHQLFDNYTFLISGAYLGIYGLSMLIRYFVKQYKKILQ